MQEVRTRGAGRPGRFLARVRPLPLALLLPLLLGACHGRPLLSQMAPGSDLRAGDPDEARRRARSGDTRAELERYSRARDLFEGRAPLTPVENVLTAREYRKIAEDLRRRDPRSSEPQESETGVREFVDEKLAHPATPSFLDPNKSYQPGQVCLDPIAISWLIVNHMRSQQAGR